jgi:hypothetical protein
MLSQVTASSIVHIAANTTAHLVLILYLMHIITITKMLPIRLICGSCVH